MSRFTVNNLAQDFQSQEKKNLEQWLTLQNGIQIKLL